MYWTRKLEVWFPVRPNNKYTLHNVYNTYVLYTIAFSNRIRLRLVIIETIFVCFIFCFFCSPRVLIGTSLYTYFRSIVFFLHKLTLKYIWAYNALESTTRTTHYAQRVKNTCVLFCTCLSPHPAALEYTRTLKPFRVSYWVILQSLY